MNQGCELFDECFLPSKLEILVGENVTWVNGDTTYDHYVESGNEISGPDGLFSSEVLSIAEKFVYQYNNTGIYSYYDPTYPWMIGVIKVKEKHTISDNVPPLILVPENMIVNADTSKGALVDFTVNAIDNESGILEPECTHESGSFFPVGNTTIICTAEDDEANVGIRHFSINVFSSKTMFPDWIKEIASMWCTDEINESLFIEAIQYLIEHEAIIVEDTEDSKEHAQEIPDWVKENACWWSEGETSEDEFANALRFLISNGIIIV